MRAHASFLVLFLSLLAQCCARSQVFHSVAVFQLGDGHRAKPQSQVTYVHDQVDGVELLSALSAALTGQTSALVPSGRANTLVVFAPDDKAAASDFVPEFPEVVKEHLQERASTVAPYVDSLHKGSFVELVSSAVAHSSRTCSMLACGKDLQCHVVTSEKQVRFQDAVMNPSRAGACVVAVVTTSSDDATVALQGLQAAAEPVTAVYVSQPFRARKLEADGDDLLQADPTTEFVRMTPDIATGLLVSFFLVAMLIVALQCLFAVQTPSTFVLTPLPPGKEF